MTTTFAIFAGRNVGTDPLPADDDRNYRQAILATLKANGASILFDGTGAGQWTDDDGNVISERSYAWLATVEDAGSLATIRSVLACIATDFAQDAIGLVVHGSEHGKSYVEAV